MRKIAEQFELYKGNVTPGIIMDLADVIGVSPSSIEALEVGLIPGSVKNGTPRAEMAWVFPERNHRGDVVGLMRRFQGGKKFCVEGSKHGLYYVYNHDSAGVKRRYTPGKHNWMRVDHTDYPNKEDGCPVCGRKKYCMVSADNPAYPAAVVCTRTKKGARTSYEYGYLHILDESRNLCGSGESVISFLDKDGPILIVEGASDTLVGLTLGIDTIGKFSNVGGMDLLKRMPIRGREVWLLGENDVKPNGDWPGKDGMERAYLALKGLCRAVRAMPPDGIKDLREWLHRGLTREELTDYIRNHGERGDDLGPDVFPDDAAMTVASRFIDTHYKDGDTLALRKYRRDWYRWNGRCYSTLSDDMLRGRVYDFLDGKSFIQTNGQGDQKVVSYKANRSRITDIIDSMSRWCLVEKDPPSWLAPVELPDPIDLIAFNNGLLDVNAYLRGDVVFHDSDPRLFSTCICPYDFDENTRSKFTEDYLLDTYKGDQNAVDLIGEWAGYCMVPDLSQEKLLLLYGEPRSGKSTILDLVTNTVGQGMCGASSLSMIGHRFGLELLIGKYLCTFGDIRNPTQEDLNRALEVILRIVGGDRVSVDTKTVRGLPSIRMPLRFAMAMNELPSFTDHTRALEGRLLVAYHATSHISDENPKIKQRILDDAEHGKMVNFALEGLKRLRANGKFSVPKTRDMVMKQFRVIAEPISTFIEDCCVIEESAISDKTTMYAAWQGWCRANMRKPGLPAQFAKWMMGHMPELAIRQITHDDSRRVRMFCGVKLNQWAASTFLE